MIALYSFVAISSIITAADIILRFPFGSEAIDYSDMQLIVIHVLGLICQAALFSFGLFQAVKGTLSSKRMGFVIAAYFCVICITSTGNYSKLTAWQLAVVEAAQIFPYVLGAIATIFYYLCNNNNKLFPSMIYAVSSWGIFQILASTIQLFRRNGQYLSINTTVNLIWVNCFIGAEGNFVTLLLGVQISGMIFWVSGRSFQSSFPLFSLK